MWIYIWWYWEGIALLLEITLHLHFKSGQLDFF